MGFVAPGSAKTPQFRYGVTGKEIISTSLVGHNRQWYCSKGWCLTSHPPSLTGAGRVERSPESSKGWCLTSYPEPALLATIHRRITHYPIRLPTPETAMEQHARLAKPVACGCSNRWRGGATRADKRDVLSSTALLPKCLTPTTRRSDFRRSEEARLLGGPAIYLHLPELGHFRTTTQRGYDKNWQIGTNLPHDGLNPTRVPT